MRSLSPHIFWPHPNPPITFGINTDLHLLRVQSGSQSRIFGLTLHRWFFFCWLFILDWYIMKSRSVWSSHHWAIWEIQDGFQDGRHWREISIIGISVVSGARITNEMSIYVFFWYEEPNFDTTFYLPPIEIQNNHQNSPWKCENSYIWQIFFP